MCTVLNAQKTTSKKVVHKAAEARGEFIGNKIADKIVKPTHVIDENRINEIVIPLDKMEQILNELRQVL